MDLQFWCPSMRAEMRTDGGLFSSSTDEIPCMMLEAGTILEATSEQNPLWHHVVVHGQKGYVMSDCIAWKKIWKKTPDG